jgi:hypothetical protein
MTCCRRIETPPPPLGVEFDDRIALRSRDFMVSSNVVKALNVRPMAEDRLPMAIDDYTKTTKSLTSFLIAVGALLTAAGSIIGALLSTATSHKGFLHQLYLSVSFLGAYIQVGFFIELIFLAASLGFLYLIQIYIIYKFTDSMALFKLSSI